MTRRANVIILLSLSVLLTSLISCYLWFQPWATKLERNYQEITVGMSLKEAQEILGAGASTIYCPSLHYGPNDDRPAVRGEKYHVWMDGGGEIWVGLEGETIVDKWIWLPSL